MARKKLNPVLTSTGQLKKDYDTGFTLDTSMLVSGLYKFRDRTQEMAKFLMEDGAVELERYMKEEAPWRNRTWKARTSLYAEVKTKNDSHGHTVITIELGSPVAYGGALEKGTSHSRPYPIIEPTVRLRVPIVMNRLQGLLDRGHDNLGTIVPW